MHKILRLPEVKKITGLSCSTIYEKMAQRTFPKQISLGAKSVGWIESEIQQWIEQKITQSISRR